MIRLHRGDKPPILEQNSETWTEEFLGHNADKPLSEIPDGVRYRYRDSAIKEALKEGAGLKCMYCESTILQVHPGEIEHILPVSKRRELVADWNNLGFVCHVCNREKGDYYNPELPLLNPYEDEPSEHLAFFGPLVLHRSGSNRGEITVRTLKLERRPGLFERRAERIEQLQLLLDRIHALPDGSLKDAVEAALQNELADSREYAATARAFVRQARASAS